jgi:GTP pyrophosphokinase
MPAGSTALDFAFSIHTFLGSHCIGAKVNHKLVPLSHKLESGDQVEILTSKSQHVQPAWLNFVSTAKAKAKIQAILRRNGRELQKKGEALLEEFLQKNGIENTQAVSDHLAQFHEVRREDFLLALADKTILLGEKDLDELQGKGSSSEKKGWRKLVPFLGRGKQKKQEEAEQHQELFIVTEKFNRKKPIYITDENIGQYKFKHCCHPIPGDDILGYIDNKHQIEIHKRACPVADKLKSSFGNRILDAKWDMHKRLFFDATIRIQGIDRMGILVDISRIITSQMNVNIHKLTIGSEEGVFDGVIEIRVYDRDNVRAIIDELKKIDGLQDVQQII